MNSMDLLFIAGVQFATAGVVLSHLATDHFSQFTTQLHTYTLLLGGCALVLGWMYFEGGDSTEVSVQ